MKSMTTIAMLTIGGSARADVWSAGPRIRDFQPAPLPAEYSIPALLL